MSQRGVFVPRSRRHCPAGIPVHIVQRGNNRQAIFTSNRDIAAYANWLEKGVAKFELRVHAWVFMTNHVHLLMTPLNGDSTSKLMQYLGRLYVRYFNYAYARSGTLFEGRFRSSLVQEENYFLTCQRYIELNPVRAGMVTDPGDYYWSSYGAHALGIRARLWKAHAVYLSLGKNGLARQKAYRELMNETLDQKVLAKIRQCVNTGLVLGSEKFRAQVNGLQS
jgi:putative transposase